MDSEFAWTSYVSQELNFFCWDGLPTYQTAGMSEILDTNMSVPKGAFRFCHICYMYPRNLRQSMFHFFHLPSLPHLYHVLSICMYHTSVVFQATRLLGISVLHLSGLPAVSIKSGRGATSNLEIWFPHGLEKESSPGLLAGSSFTDSHMTCQKCRWRKEFPTNSVSQRK